MPLHDSACMSSPGGDDSVEVNESLVIHIALGAFPLKPLDDHLHRLLRDVSHILVDEHLRLFCAHEAVVVCVDQAEFVRQISTPGSFVKVLY